jgi:hypothetical protein
MPPDIGSHEDTKRAAMADRPVRICKPRSAWKHDCLRRGRTSSCLSVNHRARRQPQARSGMFARPMVNFELSAPGEPVLSLGGHHARSGCLLGTGRIVPRYAKGGAPSERRPFFDSLAGHASTSSARAEIAISTDPLTLSLSKGAARILSPSARCRGVRRCGRSCRCGRADNRAWRGAPRRGAPR